MSDPRANGYNYGRCLQGPKPPAFHTAMKLAHMLSVEAVQKAADAWVLEMAIRNVRLACTGVEKVIALNELEREMARLIISRAS